jgi:hypothetical protein
MDRQITLDATKEAGQRDDTISGPEPAPGLCWKGITGFNTDRQYEVPYVHGSFVAAVSDRV